jgi:hypothetical protein
MPYDSAIPMLWIYLKESEVTTKILAHPHLLQHCSQQLSYGNSQDVSLLMYGLRKCDYLYTVKFYSATKENEIFILCSKWMGLKNIILSEVI